MYGSRLTQSFIAFRTELNQRQRMETNVEIIFQNKNQESSSDENLNQKVTKTMN